MKKSDIKVGEFYAVGSTSNFDSYTQALVIALDYCSNGGEKFTGFAYQKNDATLVLKKLPWIVSGRVVAELSPEMVQDSATEKLYLKRHALSKYLRNYNPGVRDEAKKELDQLPPLPQGWHLIVVANRDIRLPWAAYEIESNARQIERNQETAKRIEREKKRKAERALISDELESFGLPRLSEYATNVELSFDQYHQLILHRNRKA